MKETWDRRTWPAGPWDKEPNQLDWTTESGLPGRIVRNRLGALCGYVGLVREHSLYGRHYDTFDVEVHGGVTYAGAHGRRQKRRLDSGASPETLKRRIAYGGRKGRTAFKRTAHVHWVGFDCSHAFDLVPQFLALHDKLKLESFGPETNTYRDIAYVRAEVESLAEQLKGSPP